MELYPQLMAIGGVLTLLGIVLTWNLSRTVERFRLGTEELSWLMLLGGFLTALGFIPLMGESGNFLLWAILLGPLLIAYALAESGLVRAKREMLLQILLGVGATLVRNGTPTMLIESLSSVSIIMLINAVAFYVYTPRRISLIARTSAWIFVAFLLVEVFPELETIGAGLYIASIILWLYALLELHSFAKTRFSKTAQEGL